MEKKMEIVGGVIQETWWSFSNSPPKGIFVIRHLTNFLKKNQEKRKLSTAIFPPQWRVEDQQSGGGKREREPKSEEPMKRQQTQNKLKNKYKQKQT